MATVSAFLRVKNKNRDEHPLWVIFRHKKVEVPLATGELVSPKNFKKGKVIGDQAVVLNELVSQMGSDLYKAYDIVYKRGDEVSNATIKEEYERVKADRRVRESLTIFLEKDAAYAENQRIGVATRGIHRNEQRIEEAKAAIREAEAHIAAHQQRLAELTGTIQLTDEERQTWFTTYIQKYMDEKLNSMATNTKGTYKAVRTVINEFSPKLRILDITRTTMYQIQDFMVAKGTKNTTIENYMGKIKAICNYYALEIGLSPSYNKYVFELPTQPKDVVNLSVQQLKDFWAHDKKALYHEKQPGRTTPKKSYAQVRDMFMFMCATSLRYSDLFQGDFRDHIQIVNHGDGTTEEHIVLYPQKTRTKRIKISVPMTPMAKAILERNDYRFKRMKDSFFRDLLREYCSDIPSFQAPLTQFDYQGQNKIPVMNQDGEKIKFWEDLGSHSGRRTWINFAFQSGWTLPEITGVTGHININTLMVYANKIRVVRSGPKPLELFHTLQP